MDFTLVPTITLRSAVVGPETTDETDGRLIGQSDARRQQRPTGCLSLPRANPRRNNASVVGPRCARGVRDDKDPPAAERRRCALDAAADGVIDNFSVSFPARSAGCTPKGRKFYSSVRFPVKLRFDATHTYQPKIVGNWPPIVRLTFRGNFSSMRFPQTVRRNKNRFIHIPIIYVYISNLL